jgi:hypothetical protein
VIVYSIGDVGCSGFRLFFVPFRLCSCGSEAALPRQQRGGNSALFCLSSMKFRV